MNSTRYASVRAELARMKAAKIRDSGWFSLWDRDETIRWLAIYLKIGSLYDALYRGWSNVAHGEKRDQAGNGWQWGYPSVDSASVAGVIAGDVPQRLSAMQQYDAVYCAWASSSPEGGDEAAIHPGREAGAGVYRQRTGTLSLEQTLIGVHCASAAP